MEQNNHDQAGSIPNGAAPDGNIPHGSEGFRTIPNTSETFGMLPQASESFRNVPHPSASFRSVPKTSERKEDHTLTVREAARLFETAGVARTERSITNWCQPNAQGVARLDAYFDPNERKYFITPQSVERAIQEELARAAKANEPSEPFRTVPKGPEEPEKPTGTRSETNVDRVWELENETRDLQITNRAKDLYIEQLKGERDDLFQEAMKASRKVGELENKLLQLSPPTISDSDARDK
jgi:hypothetical protein